MQSPALFGGRCDYSPNQQAICGESSDNDIYTECSYYLCVINFTQAVVNEYMLTSDVETFGVKFGFKLFSGTTPIQFNERSYLRNTSTSFDGNWKLEDELVLRAGAPDDTIVLEETGLTGVVYLKLRDKYLSMDMGSEYIFDGKRAFHLKFVSTKDGYSYFSKQHSVAVINGNSEKVYTFKTYHGDCAVGFSHSNPQFFAAYADYKYGLQFQFVRSDQQGSACSSVIPDGETECVMSEWSDWTPCDESCKRTQSRTRVSGSTEGCPPTRLEASCPDGTEIYRHEWIPDECDCENGVYVRYQQYLTCESDGQKVSRTDTENCECPDIECEYSDWYETTACDPTTCLQQLSRTVLNLPEDYHTCTEPLNKSYQCCDTNAYSMGAKSTSCDDGQLITTEWQCKNAAQNLGLDVKTKYNMGDPYEGYGSGEWDTKGCYVKHAGSSGDYLYFNQNVNSYPRAYSSLNTPLCMNPPDLSAWTPTVYYGAGQGSSGCDWSRTSSQTRWNVGTPDPICIRTKPWTI